MTEVKGDSSAKVVDIAIFLNNVGQIDAATGTVEVDFYLRYRWKDPHTKDVKEGLTGAEIDIENKQWWNPQLEVTNRVSLDPIGETAVIDKDWVIREIRYHGGIRCNMPLHEFPFDTQRIEISIESTEHAKDKLVFEPWSHKGNSYNEENILEHPEFEIMGTTGEVLDHEYPYALIEGEDKGEVFSKFFFVLRVERRAGYYMTKIGAILAMCMACSWATCWMDPSDIGNRLGIFTTMFLTAVAFQYVVDSKLPNIPYLTKLDRLVTACYVLLLLGGVENVIIYQMSLFIVDAQTLFHADMISFALLAGTSLGLAFWFKVLHLRHEEDHVIELKRHKGVPESR